MAVPKQYPILPGRTHIEVPSGYRPDLHWKASLPKEEHNYVRVEVGAGQQTKFTLNRFRPWAAEPFESVDLLGRPHGRHRNPGFQRSPISIPAPDRYAGAASRWRRGPVPFGKETIIQLVATIVLRALPLVLTEIPLEEVVRRLLGALL